jgi:hypothetical protein
MHGPSVRVSALDEVGDRDASIGSRPWALWVVGQAKLQRDELEREGTWRSIVRHAVHYTASAVV